MREWLWLVALVLGVWLWLTGGELWSGVRDSGDERLAASAWNAENKKKENGTCVCLKS